jgi:hypothetical protein
MRDASGRKDKKPMPKPKRFKTTLYLPPELWKAVKIAAIESDRDATELVVEALQQYLKKGSRS